MSDDKDGAQDAGRGDFSDADSATGSETGRVFLSYSRKDRERAAGIADALRARHFGVFKDTDDILPTEEWKHRLEELIEEADTIVFLLSPDSAASEICAWEVEYATALNKRIAPIVIEDVEGKDIPPLLARLNFVFCTPRDPFENAVDTLVSALSTDIGWIREHTRLAGLSRRWDETARPARLLLRGQDIAAAEEWRDGRPKDAPEVTASQAALIAASRRAAGARQRNWIVGSVGATVGAVALAVFAYVQSIEADRQRVAAEDSAREASRQQTLAENNAAEARRQRAEAEARRSEALMRLAGDRLRVGDRPGGLQALMQADPDAPQIPTLMAGLAKGSEIFPRIVSGIPISVNGQIHLSAKNAPPVPVASFPAKNWLLPGSNTLLLSETGAMRLHGRDGGLKGESRNDFAFAPCFAQFAGEGMRVFGTMSPGYSACSPRLVEVAVSGDGDFQTRVHPFCDYDETNKVRLNGPDQVARPPDEIGQYCLGEMDGETEVAILTLAPDITTPTRMAELRFPRAAAEHGLWSSNRPADDVALTGVWVDKIRGLPLGPDDLERFAIMNFEGSAAGGYHAPDLMSDERMELAASLYIWGGTGGEVHTVCSGPREQNARCHDFHTFSGFDGVAVDGAKPRFAIFGDGLTPDNFDGDGANLWIVDAPDATPRSVPGADVYGRITDIAFHPDGRMAALTGSALLLFDAGIATATALPVPEGAEALLWLSNGEMVALGQDALHFSSNGQVFDRIPIDMGTQGAAPNGSVSLWLRATPDEQTFVVGSGDVVMLFDRALRAPLSDPYETNDPRLKRSATAARLERISDGGFRIAVNGLSYVRTGYDGTDPDDRLDPGAPLR